MNIANKLTLLRIFLIPVMAVVYCLGWRIAAAVIFVLAALTDILDGQLARKWNMVTVLGKFLDPIADKMLNISALILLIWHTGSLYITVVTIIIIAREFAVTGFRVIAASNNNIIAADGWGKLKTIVQDIAIVLLMLDNMPFNLIGLPMDLIFLSAAVILTIISGVRYVYLNKELLK